MPFQALADAVLVLHWAVVVCVVGGLVLLPPGHALGWRWVSWRPFRLAHAAGVVLIAVQAWLGQYCPLTLLEFWLRAQAAGGGLAPPASFIQYWLQRWLYIDAPLWLFALAYTAFALLVALAWRVYPPRPWRRMPSSPL